MSGPSQQYGQQAAQARSLAAVPAASGDLTAPGGTPDAMAGGPPDLNSLLANPALAGMVGPDEIANASDPSTMPETPLTNGLSSGLGAGPEALGPMMDNDPTRMALRAMVARFPSTELTRMLDDLDVRGG